MRRLLAGQVEGCEPYAKILALCDEFSKMKIYEIIKKGMHEFLDEIQGRIIEVNDSIYTAFFSMAPAPSREIQNEFITNA